MQWFGLTELPLRNKHQHVRLLYHLPTNIFPYYAKQDGTIRDYDSWYMIPDHTGLR